MKGNMLNLEVMNNIETIKQHIIADIDKLPEVYLKELLDFADFLMSKYKNEENPKWKRKLERIKIKPGKDSSEYLREERDLV